LGLCRSFPSGLVATINLNYVQHPDKGELSVVGDKGWATLDMIPPGIQHVKIGRVSSFGEWCSAALRVQRARARSHEPAA
jgi:hypothetical protein